MSQPSSIPQSDEELRRGSPNVRTRRNDCRLGLMHMGWLDLAFFHWPVAPAAIQSRLPAGVELDLFDGQAWIGISPFYMTNVRPRCIPPIPGVSAFAELNVRTYVIAGDKPGIWFFSLDAASRLGVRVARFALSLPYFDADIKYQPSGDRVRYECRRTHPGAPPAAFVASYGPAGAVYHTTPGNLDHWLTERYCLYTLRKKTLLRLDIHHAKWPLQPAEGEIETNTMLAPLSLPSPTTSPLVHFAKRVDVIGCLPVSLQTGVAAANHPHARYGFSRTRSATSG